jgi:hypothetical protein
LKYRSNTIKIIINLLLIGLENQIKSQIWCGS